MTDRRRRTFARLVLFLLAAGLPLAVSFTWTSDPLAPKRALWMAGAALLLLFPRPILPLGRGGAILLALLGLAAAGSFRALSEPGPLLPYVLGAICWFRARDLGRDPAFLPRYVRLVVVVATLAALNGISQAAWNQIFSGVKIVNPFGQRILSTLGNPTFLGDYLALSLPLALFLASAAAGFARFAAWAACAAAIAAATVLSGSKGGQAAGLTAALIWIGLEYRRGSLTLPRLAATGALVAAAVGVLALTTTSPSYAIERWFSAGERFSFSQRAGIAASSARLLARAPVLGNGPGTYPVLIPRCQTDDLNRSLGITLSVNHAHCDFLEIACDLGLAGLGLVVLLFALARHGGGLSPERTGLGLSLIAMAVSMSSNFFLFVPSSALFFWVHAGLLSGGGSERAAPRAAAPLLAIGAACLALAAGRGLAGAALFTAGADALQRGDAAAAAPILARATVVEPRNRHLWQFLGRAYEETRRWEDSLAAYGMARALGPYHAVTSLNVGRVEGQLYRSGEGAALARALAAFLDSVEANPHQIQARVGGGELALEARDLPRARRFLADVPEGLAGDAGWHRLRGRFFLSTGDGEAAAREAVLARKIEAAAALQAAERDYAAGRRAAAIGAARRIAAANPALGTAWETLGYFLHESGSFSEARRCYRKLARLDPGSLVAHLNLAHLAMRDRDAGAAAGHVAAARRIAPDSPDVGVVSAQLHLLRGDRDAAVSELKRVLEGNPGHPQAEPMLRSLVQP